MTVEVGWACLGGIEIINDARVLSYLRNGLAGAAMVPAVAVATSGTFSGMIEAPYSDIYSDAYGLPFTIDCADGFAPVCLECACAALTVTETYDDPATDDAPWYTSANTRSADFLGVLSTMIEMPPPTVRSQQPRTRFGGTPSPQQLGPRIVQVTAQLFAANSGGLEWGKRWLFDVLAGACDAPSDLTLLPFCPADETDLDAAYRILADTVLVDGPTFSDAGTFHDFRTCTVAFQVASSAPWLLGVPAECSTSRLTAGNSLSCLIETDDWGGGQAIRLTATGDIDGLHVTAIPLAADQDCPLEGGMPCSEFTVTGTQDGDTLIIDSARRSALLTDISSKNDVSAIAYLDFDGPFHWIDAPPCTRLCVTVSNEGGGAADVTLETVLREL